LAVWGAVFLCGLTDRLGEGDIARAAMLARCQKTFRFEDAETRSLLARPFDARTQIAIDLAHANAETTWR
jgi:hypothetical protein